MSEPEIKLPDLTPAPHYADMIRLLTSPHADIYKTTEILARIMTYALKELPAEKLVELWTEELCEPYLALAEEVHEGERAELGLDITLAEDEEAAEESAPRVY